MQILLRTFVKSLRAARRDGQWCSPATPIHAPRSAHPQQTRVCPNFARSTPSLYQVPAKLRGGQKSRQLRARSKRERVNRPRKRAILFRQSARIVSSQRDAHPAIHVAPLGVVVGYLCGEGNAGHEAPGRRKVGEAELPGDGLELGLGGGNRPKGEGAEEGSMGGGREAGSHSLRLPVFSSAFCNL